MKTIIKSAYEDAQLEMKKAIPEKMQMSFGKNKKKFLFIAGFVLVVELLVLSNGYQMVFG